MAKNYKKASCGSDAELGQWALYARDGAREDTRRWGGHFRQKGLPVQVSGLIKDTMNPRKGTQCCWKVRSGDVRKALGTGTGMVNYRFREVPLDNIAQLVNPLPNCAQQREDTEHVSSEGEFGEKETLNM